MPKRWQSVSAINSTYIAKVDAHVTRTARLNVDDLQEAVKFYSKLFGTEPTKLRPGYANFAIAEPPLKLVLLENPGQGGTINHLGVEVESSEKVHARSPA